MKILYASILALGCSAAGDGMSTARMTLSVPYSFTPEQVAMTEDARDQWCAANGWCPATVYGAAGKRVSIERDGFVAPGSEGVAAHTHVAEQDIVVQEWALDAVPDMFWIIIAHEMGHLQGIKHHGGPECTMFWEHLVPSYELACER